MKFSHRDKSASFIKLFSQISTKMLKEVNEIFKFFKKNNILAEKDMERSYTQVLSPKNSDILKIKKTFLKLQANKINNIYKIINNSGKLKPKINMMTKGPSRKQVIIPMSNDNKAKFMKIFSTHITNINKALESVKSEVMAKFVCMDQADIIIVTNKVTSSLDFLMIKKYIKNTNLINSNNVNTSYYYDFILMITSQFYHVL